MTQKSTMATLFLDAGKQTEDLLSFLTNELDDDTLDEIDIQRKNEKSEKLATEPLTTAALITLSIPTVVVVGRIIERWIEKKHQLEQLKIVASGFAISEEAGKTLAKLSTENSKVSITYPLLTLPHSNKASTEGLSDS